MTIELKMLLFSTILGIVHIMLTTQFVTKDTGLKYNMSPRDEPSPPLSKITGRLSRSLKNFGETFPFFAAAVLVLQASGNHSELSAVGAQMYFYGRVLHIPCYAFGVTGVRTLAWLASLVGIGLVLFSAF